MTTAEVFSGFLGDASRAFYYGHSYTANQLGCAAALASLQVFREERVLERLPEKISHFAALLSVLPAKEIRQCGLIAGIEIEGPPGTGAAVCMRAREYGLLTRPIGNVIVLMPPLCVTREEMQRMMEALHRALGEL